MTASPLCPLCGGSKKPGYTVYCVDLGLGVVVVRGVPAQVCTQCGEEWIEASTAAALEQIVESARQRRLQVEVLEYSAAA